MVQIKSKVLVFSNLLVSKVYSHQSSYWARVISEQHYWDGMVGKIYGEQVCLPVVFVVPSELGSALCAGLDPRYRCPLTILINMIPEY